MTELGLLPQAHMKIAQLHHQLLKPEQQSAHTKVLDMEVDILRDRVYSLKKQFDQSKTTTPVIGSFKGPTTAKNSIPVSEKQTNSEKTYYGLHGLDKKLEAYLDYDNGYFVELGANDGINQSNTYYFEKERGWKGLLIEPILHNFLKCKANRSAENSFACAACVSFTYNKPTVNLIYSNLMTTPVGVETDLPDPQAHAQSGKVYLRQEEDVVEIHAPAKTLTSLLDEANAPRIIDLLSLDVEGAEIEVLKGIDFNKYQFRYLLIESRDERLVDDYLSKNSYLRIDKLSNHDYLYASTIS
jgi:FkbM family methyltransferase